jgi:hypothetical protein
MLTTQIVYKASCPNCGQNIESTNHFRVLMFADSHECPDSEVTGKKLLFGYDGGFTLTPDLGRRKMTLDVAEEYAVELDRINVEELRDYLNFFLRQTK